jgi:hypothetical protein
MNATFVDELQRKHFEALRDWHSRSMGMFCRENVFKKLPEFLGIETDPDKPPPSAGELMGIPVSISPFAPEGKISLVLTYCRNCGNDFMTYGVCPTCGSQTETKIISIPIGD